MDHHDDTPAPAAEDGERRAAGPEPGRHRLASISSASMPSRLGLFLQLPAQPGDCAFTSRRASLRLEGC
jgi:hypothetical protein